MPVLFKTFRSTRANKDNQKLYHPRVVHTGTVSTAQLAREIAEYSSLSTGDVRNTIDNLVTVMTKHMQASEVVQLEGLGSFGLVLRSAGKGALTPDEVTASQARMGVRFIPAMRRNPNLTVATRTFITGARCVPYSLGIGGSDQTGGSGSGTPDSGDDGGDNPIG